MIENNLGVSLVSIIPDCEQVILKCARVSSNNPESKSTALLKYLIKNQHWSPFQMGFMVISITCSRDISRQILRHSSFGFQEFSQRYQNVDPNPILREARKEHPKSRQSSLELDDNDDNLKKEFESIQLNIWNTCIDGYKKALDSGIAKEQARCLLPEGMTETKLYMAGTIRSFIHYILVRTQETTQKEHREIAEKIKQILKKECPIIIEALFN